MFFKKHIENIEIVIANPAGNITAFVENAENLNRRERLEIAKKILNEKTLNVEQVGFVIKPKTQGSLWRLEMAGGEFCGNAARSFALYVRQTQIEISGAQNVVTVDYSVDCYKNGDLHGSAKVKMPLPISRETVIYKNIKLPFYVFEGISHVIAQGIDASNETFFEIKKLVEAQHRLAKENCGENCGALGVMFYDKEIMHPVVYVYSIDTLYHESSCGSGSAAFAIEHFLDDKNIEGRLEIRQCPHAQDICAQDANILEITVLKKDGELVSVAIGGAVTLQPRIRLP
jgi:diaminopimelate epimerase